MVSAATLFYVNLLVKIVTLAVTFVGETLEIRKQFSGVSQSSSKYKTRHAHKRLYTVLPKYSKIQVLPGITSCRLMKYNKQAIELNSLLNK